MKATIDFDAALYRRLKVEAARRGRTVRELVAEGVRYVLDTPPPHEAVARSDDARLPAWYGALSAYGAVVTDHSMEAIRTSVAKGRSARGKA